jgi:hypothetical protein
MSDHTRVFLVARNPDADSKLPYCSGFRSGRGSC